MSPLISVQHLRAAVQYMAKGSCGLPTRLLIINAQLTGAVHHLAPPGQVVRGSQGVGGCPHCKAHDTPGDREDVGLPCYVVFFLLQ